MPAFDPYERWLGIKTNSRSLTLYRLLALEPFEDDPEVISNAAKRQSFHLRELDDSRHETREKVLDQIALAKAVLLDPTQKRLYDSQLRAKQARSKPPKRKPKQNVASHNKKRMPDRPTIIELPNDRVNSKPASTRWNISPVLSMLGGVCAFAILFFAVMNYLAMNSTGTSQTQAKSETPSQASSALRSKKRPQQTSPQYSSQSIPQPRVETQPRKEPIEQSGTNQPNTFTALKPNVTFNPIGIDPAAKSDANDVEVPFFDESLFDDSHLQVSQINPLPIGMAQTEVQSEPPSEVQGEGQRETNAPKPIVPPVASLSRNRLGMHFRWCSPGTFRMNHPQNEAAPNRNNASITVKIKQGFWISKTEVTQREWSAVMTTQPWQGTNANVDNARQPATFLTYQDAVDYCKRLTEADQAAGKLPAEWMYSLPTEAQWEYACGAGEAGIPFHRLSYHAWFSGDHGYMKRPQPVGMKLPNAWGLYDMHGNVAEFCLDSSGGTHIVRGGSCRSDASECAITARGRGEDGERRSDVGFRLVIVPAS